MYQQDNRPGNQGTIEFKNLMEAEDAIIALSNEIKTIEQQLQNRGRVDNFSNKFEYNNWKKKAQVAMAVKIKQLEYTKRWMSLQKNNSKRIPTEDVTEDIDLSLPSNLNSNVAERRPNADKVIDNLSGAILQMRAMKRRLYAFYKIANAAFDVLKETGITDLESQRNLVYWLERTGYDVNLICGTENRSQWQEQQDNPHNEQDDDYAVFGDA